MNVTEPTNSFKELVYKIYVAGFNDINVDFYADSEPREFEKWYEENSKDLISEFSKFSDWNEINGFF